MERRPGRSRATSPVRPPVRGVLRRASLCALLLCPLGVSCATPALAPAERESLLRAPFTVPSTHYFHAALLVPPLRRAAALPPGAAELRLRSSHARSLGTETIDGIESHFDGLYRAALAAESAYGIGGAREISLEAEAAGWDEQLDEFELFDEAGNPIVVDEDAHLRTGEASSRHENLSVLRLRALQELGGGESWTWSLEGAVKIPFGRDRDLTHAGTWDPALTFRHSIEEGRWTAHSAAGLTWPIGEQNIFVEAADVELEPFLHGGAGAVRIFGGSWSAGAQVFGHTSAFGDVEFLDHPGASIVIGARHLLGPWAIEAGGGPGIEWSGSHRWLFFIGGTLRY